MGESTYWTSLRKQVQIPGTHIKKARVMLNTCSQCCRVREETGGLADCCEQMMGEPPSSTNVVNSTKLNTQDD